MGAKVSFVLGEKNGLPNFPPNLQEEGWRGGAGIRFGLPER